MTLPTAAMTNNMGGPIPLLRALKGTMPLIAAIFADLILVVS
jgi:hypothetical protein